MPLLQRNILFLRKREIKNVRSAEEITQTSGVECAELRMCPNEFESDPERNCRLIKKKKKEDNKNG